MPNPLMSGRVVTSKTNVDRPVAIEPVEEHYAGDNNPYRGIENHGVASVNPWRETDEDMPDHDGRLVTVYETDDDTPDPIPVVVVNESSRERRAFRTVVSYAGGTDNGRARMLIGQDVSRSQATIRNKSVGAVIWINDTPETANALSGFPIEQGGTYVTYSQEAIYATVDQASDMSVPIAIEYRVSLDD